MADNLKAFEQQSNQLNQQPSLIICNTNAEQLGNDRMFQRLIPLPTFDFRNVPGFRGEYKVCTQRRDLLDQTNGGKPSWFESYAQRVDIESSLRENTQSVPIVTEKQRVDNVNINDMVQNKDNMWNISTKIR